MANNQSELIRAALKAAGLTQTAYCNYRGIAFRTFQNWLSEKTNMPGWLQALILRDIAEAGEILHK